MRLICVNKNEKKGIKIKRIKSRVLETMKNTYTTIFVRGKIDVSRHCYTFSLDRISLSGHRTAIIEVHKIMKRSVTVPYSGF